MVGALPLQYCESRNAGDTCGVGANTCTGFECRCGEPFLYGATPFCVSRNGISVCASVLKMATVLETQAVNIARQIIPVKIASTRDSTAEIRLFMFKAVNLMHLWRMQSQRSSGRRMRSRWRCPTASKFRQMPGMPSNTNGEDGAWATGMTHLCQHPGHPLGVVWHVIHRIHKMRIARTPLQFVERLRANVGNPDAQQNECPEDNVCQQDGTCVED